jgi:L-cysteate sulfo-lyase
MDAGKKVAEKIGRMPRVKLARLPTPLEELSSLSRMLKGPRMFIKRDDLTGMMFSGNKARKAEFLLGDAQERGADVVLTTGSPNSNHTRVISAGARKLGMDAVLFVKGNKPKDYTGNLLLNAIFGAEIRFLGLKPYIKIQKEMEREAKALVKRGRRPYVIPVGGANAIGATGYVNAFFELHEQAREMGISIDHIVHCSGTGGTHSGLVYGAKVLGAKTKVIAISDGTPKEELVSDARRLIEDLSDLFGVKVALNRGDLIVDDDAKYIGKGYGIPSKEGIDVIKLLATNEGILLDPVYSSKAMVGMIDLIWKGAFERDENVIFLHTGGAPAIFSFGDEIWR